MTTRTSDPRRATAVFQAATLHVVTYPPANCAIARLEKLGVLREVTGEAYGRRYALDAVLNIWTGPPISIRTMRLSTSYDLDGAAWTAL